MTRDFEALLEAARQIHPTPQDREAQRRSFAYGNAAYENDKVTRDMIDRQADLLEAEKNDERG